MLAKQIAARGLHQPGIQRRAQLPGTVPIKRGTHWTIENHVTVGARQCRVSRVKIRLYGPDPLDRDIRGQIAVDAAQPGIFGTTGDGVEMHHLAAGVHTGIGTPCGSSRQGFVGDGTDRSIQRGLNAACVALDLPAEEFAAVVFNPGSKTLGDH